MSGDLLSQAEVESLLHAMEGGSPDAAPAAGSGSKAKSKSRSREKVTPYDFKRPERVGKEQMRALQTLHEGFSRNFGASLSGLLRSIIEVKLTSVDQLTYSEFVFSLENPTCFNLLKAEPLEGNLILDINPGILFPIIDRLLGGGSEHAHYSRRPLTEIELRLVSRITGLFLKELGVAWDNVLPLTLEVERVESNPQLVQIVPPNEVVVLISFELTIGETRGMMNLCIPFNSIERVSNHLTANSWFSFNSKPATPETIGAITGQLQGSTVEMIVNLAETKIGLRDLVGLRVGDIITTEKDVKSPLSIDVQGRTKYLCSVGHFKGRKAIQVEESMAQPKLAQATVQ
ncbi:MAG: flagellar motor switch protein FliM [Planctomycetales bacterium]|nr:flagellar motor switch protein FliM [Planctomycetales bacterium]